MRVAAPLRLNLRPTWKCWAIRAVALTAAAVNLGNGAPKTDPSAASCTPIETSSIFAGKTTDPYKLALRAYVWGYPLVRAAQNRYNLTSPDNPTELRLPTVAGAPINRLGHARELSSPTTRVGVAPNNDTLYSLAWLDMDAGPFVLETPPFEERYYTFQFGQADTSTRQALGQRTHGGTLPPVFIQGPKTSLRVPRGMVGVRSDQRYMMIVGRTLIRSPDDFAIVHELQRKMLLYRWADRERSVKPEAPITPQQPLLPLAGERSAADEYLTMLGSVLRDWRPTGRDIPIVTSFRGIGLSPTNGFIGAALTPAARQEVERGVADGQAIVRCNTVRLGRNVNGWAINTNGSRFGSDYLLRAAVAMDMIYVLPREEALYPNARVDSQGRELDGRRHYVLRFAKDQWPPVEAFWSATMYHAKGLMVANEINRYAIGDRTPGLKVDADGGITIRLQHDRPRDGVTSNWLPAPDGPFMLMLRLYRPRSSGLEGSWAPPSIEEVSD